MYSEDSNINDTPRREENPFSLKHFLRSDLSSYQSQGARPKVYCDGRQIGSTSELNSHIMEGNKQARLASEFSSALPDFVQDHLIVEQCYKDSQHEKNLANLENLPDFAQSSRSTGSRNILRPKQNTDRGNISLRMPYDPPIRSKVDFPLDLPTGK